MDETANDQEHAGREQILAYLKDLDARLSRIEAQLNLSPADEQKVGATQFTETTPGEAAEEKLELQIGQNWFAKAGIVVLALGVVFLLTFPYRNLPPALPSVFGYVLVGVILALSRYLRIGFPQVSRYLLGGGLLLLYFTTLRLFHFSAQPALTNNIVELALLVIVVTIDLGISLQTRSAYLIGISLALGYLSAAVYNEAYVVFALILVLSGTALYLERRFRFSSILLLAIILSNLTHAIWAVNNPFIGRDLHLVQEPEVNLLFILLYSLVFAGGTLLREGEEERVQDIFSAFLNGVLSYALFLILSLIAFSRHAVVWQLLASLEFLFLSVAFWIHRSSRYATFVYAMLGYTALSVAILSQFQIPESFVWLCWQSVLVLSTAVWFRSRFIVVANFVIYLIVFAAYLITVGTVSMVSLSFGIVALISARILNWKKHTLELRTELMRNAYLACALFIIPYALYHAVPAGYVSLSWLVVALLYYLISRYLHNRKYRWMALLTTLLTILYVVFVDLVGVDPTLRIVSFLVLGSALITISMFYSRKRRKAGSGGE